ncbi:MAG: hypothetical protein SOR89_04630 [Ndongobacter sp.]|nr:hypothetical protein [Ndongobacter sp.]
MKNSKWILFMLCCALIFSSCTIAPPVEEKHAETIEQEIDANPKELAAPGRSVIRLELLEASVFSDLSKVTNDEFRGEGARLRRIEKMPPGKVYALFRFRIELLKGDDIAFPVNHLEIKAAPGMTAGEMYEEADEEFAKLVYLDVHPSGKLLTERNYFRLALVKGERQEFTIGAFLPEDRDEPDAVYLYYGEGGFADGKENTPVPYFRAELQQGASR